MSPALVHSSDLFDSSSAAYKKARRQKYKNQKHGRHTPDTQWTPFRAAEKRYKARFPPPNLSDALDLSADDESNGMTSTSAGLAWKGRSDATEVRQIPLKGEESVKQANGERAYVFPRIPGLVLLPGFVSPNEQRSLIRWALCDQARDNETNLSAHYLLPEAGLWHAHLQSRDSGESHFVQPLASTLIAPPAVDEKPGPRRLVENTPASPTTYDSLASERKPPPAPSATAQSTPASGLLAKLRWANIGWFYHWGTKQYDFSKVKKTIDERIRGLCRRAVCQIDWGKVFWKEEEWGEEAGSWKEWDHSYEPDAGIVNFYQYKDTLMGHVDRSEVCATSPLVSLSLGNAAIFLIGGHTRDVEPLPIILRSGDVVIMAGPRCRRAYHGVPRILEDTLPRHLADHEGDKDWRPFAEYMRTTRINVNVRQVFPKGFEPGIGASS